MNEEMYFAHLATANYDFYIVADSEETMFLELERTWNAHKEKTNATYTWEDVRDDVWWILQPINRVWKRG